MHLAPGTAPAPGAPTRRPRRVDVARQASPNGVTGLWVSDVVGEGASHSARDGRRPQTNHSHRAGIRAFTPARGGL